MRLNNTNRRRLAAAAFTLVELLVVIAIIGILAALLLAAVGPARDAAARARIRAEMTQFDTALEDYKNSVGSYPPNAQTDALATYPHLDNARVLSDFRRHFNKAFPQNREKPQLIEALVGASSLAQGSVPSGANNENMASNLPGGMNAAEALVFWLGGFSDDPKYPITGPGGPSYPIPASGNPHQADPIESRSWRLGIDIQQLGPRDEQKYFPAAYARYINFIDDRDGSTRRINFWFYKAPNSPIPYAYFDTSRGAGASATNDPPALTAGADYSGARDDEEAFRQMQYVHAIKVRNSSQQASNPFLFANNDGFQILHAGTDEDWGVLPMVSTSPPATTDPNDSEFPEWLINSQQWHDSGNDVTDFVFFPDGPWSPETADTLSNFADGTLGDNQE